ncbi:hypothetical protein TRIATDRAFT_323033 [Trichoderma atroviride IMI 206040]|uniref:Xylanolytic transcriptional activator regulatory domain-containing protein n=1 Tax=Hypocrea atroviridis (strain ATCC 20476 / IMI 206040) TaxID=452589 RepID=G9PCA1_HYPAI|nr:uncharacterized protein TRIATDRAFT_323033 [Trichoderma atroviride IMI 206040]EHK39475.1 hypothetical protein TRIATDRAFT_323033 [Trichoderma atroviride IMI 206040]
MLASSEQSDSLQEDNVSSQPITSTTNQYALPSSNLSALFFLDPPVFRNHNIDIPKAFARLPSSITGQLGNSQQQEEIGNRFFNTIHAWLPMVSRKRFYEDLRIHSENLSASADLAFLLLGMKLMTWQPLSEDDVSPVKQTARTATYIETKRFGFELEASGMFSLRVLQGLLLVAFYEVGHAIYPAAFMSIAACVRYAHALGIHPGGLQRLKLPLTWVEEEERKRVWWAAFLLDRFVSLSCPGCPATVDEPEPEDALPTDDELWDEGVKKVPRSPLLKNPVNIDFGRFAVLIQAFALMSKVQRLTSSSRNIPPHLLKEEAQRLERAIKALYYFGRIERKPETGLPSSEFHSVSQISLIAIYTCSTIPIEMPDKFIESLADALNAPDYEDLVTAAQRGQDEISPFLIQLIYQASVILLKIENHQDENWSDPKVEKLKSALLWLDKRWKLAGVFYQALEAQQIALSRGLQLA